jgi:hypothetical protein
MVLPGEGREEEGPGSFGRLSLDHLELGGGEKVHYHLVPLTCGFVGGALGSKGGAVPDYP